jgi:hypothetical protein
VYMPSQVAAQVLGNGGKKAERPAEPERPVNR